MKENSRDSASVAMRERISAFADGELPDEQIDQVLGDLNTPTGRAFWHACHSTREALKGSGLLPAPDLSAGFDARFAARLANEPTVMAARPSAPVRRYALPAALAAGVAATAFLVLQLGAPATVAPESGSALASVAREMTHGTVNAQGEAWTARLNPGLDAYLTAHQMHSPSAVTAFARSVGFPSERQD